MNNINIVHTLTMPTPPTLMEAMFSLIRNYIINKGRLLNQKSFWLQNFLLVSFYFGNVFRCSNLSNEILPADFSCKIFSLWMHV